MRLRTNEDEEAPPVFRFLRALGLEVVWELAELLIGAATTVLKSNQVGGEASAASGSSGEAGESASGEAGESASGSAISASQ